MGLQRFPFVNLYKGLKSSEKPGIQSLKQLTSPRNEGRSCFVEGGGRHCISWSFAKGSNFWFPWRMTPR